MIQSLHRHDTEAKRLTACHCHMIQISLHYECKDEFKNTQGCELCSHALWLCSFESKSLSVSNVANVTEESTRLEVKHVT